MQYLCRMPIEYRCATMYAKTIAGGNTPQLQRTAARRPGKEEVKMKTPSASELLVQETRTAERLRLLMIANECKTIEEFRQRLADLLK